MKKNKLMTHVVAGYPNMDECEKIVLAMAESGVSFIEIQIPFSDPIADGPTIMKANEISLLNGTTLEDCFILIEKLKKQIETPILIMTYFNIPFIHGLKRFCERANKLGVYGLIIPDMPIDEEPSENYLQLCKENKLHAIQVISPITNDKRLKQISQHSSGFLYCVSSLGTTGERSELNPQLDSYLQKVREFSDLPLALGFGISSKEQVVSALKHADIAVIGSKIINLIDENQQDEIGSLKKFLNEII